jgi:hypothetical protein
MESLPALLRLGKAISIALMRCVKSEHYTQQAA